MATIKVIQNGPYLVQGDDVTSLLHWRRVMWHLSVTAPTPLLGRDHVFPPAFKRGYCSIEAQTPKGGVRDPAGGKFACREPPG